MSAPSPTEKINFLDRNPPRFEDQQVQRIAAELFGLEGKFNPLASDCDQNFRVLTARDESFVFKIANVDEDPDVVDLQIQGLLHLEKVDPGLPVPRVVPGKSGEPSAWIEAPGGARHIVRVLTYLPGADLGKVALTPALLRNLGGAVARLDRALQGFCHRAARHDHLWDLRQVPRLRPLTSHITDKTGRARVEGVLDHFTTNLLPRLKRLRAQVIHNDANGDNVLVGLDAPDQIAGIVDFGDMIHSTLVNDPAVTAADLDLGGDIIGPMCELLAGYSTVLPFEDDEIDVICDLVLVRWAITAIIMSWRIGHSESPGPFESSELAAAQAGMDSLLSLGRSQVRTRLRSACRLAR